MGDHKLIEQVEDPSFLDSLDEPDGFLYHVTPEPRARRILEQGLRPGMKPTFSNWAGHSNGKVFLTERAGVRFWMQRVEEHLEHEHDDPPGVVVLRVPRSAVADLIEPDPAGSRDSREPSYFLTEPLLQGPFCAPENEAPQGP